MRKSIILLLLALVSCVTMQAKDGLTFSFLQGETAISFAVDWSDLTINGMKPDDWIEFRNIEQPEYNATREYEDQLLPRYNDLIARANKELANVNLFITKTAGRKYTLTIKPQNITKKGDCSIECTIRETTTGRRMVEFVITGKGGTFGSMSNLWGDGMKSAGKKLGKLICKHLGYDPTVRDRIDRVLSKAGIE